MQLEYFVSTDGQCPPRGNRRVPSAADGWISQLITESASLRQAADLKNSEEDVGMSLRNPLQAITHHRLPIVSENTNTFHAFRASLGLPTQPQLPARIASIADAEAHLPQGFAATLNECDAFIEKMFPFRQRSQFVFEQSNGVPQESLHWSLAEDRALLQLDAACQPLSEGYLALQKRFPNLYPKTVDAWLAFRELDGKQKQDTADLVRDVVEASNPDLLKSVKGMKSLIVDSMTTHSEFVLPDIIFKNRLQELRASADRQRLLLALPEDPAIFLPPLTAEDEVKLLVPPPKQREPSVESRREALRRSLFAGNLESKEAKDFLEAKCPDAFIECVSSDKTCTKVSCNRQAVLANAPFFERQIQTGERSGFSFRMDINDGFWEEKGMAKAFDHKTVGKFVALCQNPNLLPRLNDLRHAYSEACAAYSTQYSSFEESVNQRQEENLRRLDAEKKAKCEMTTRFFSDMLSEDINTLTRIYRQHVEREVKQIDAEYESRLERVVVHCREELGYLKLARNHFEPSDLKLLRERVAVVEGVVNKDILSTDDLPELLKLSEAVLASGVTSQILQSLVATAPPIEIVKKSLEDNVSITTISEYLSLLSDARFVEFFNAAVPGGKPFFRRAHREQLKHQPVTNLNLCLGKEWDRRFEAKLHILGGMGLDAIGALLSSVRAYKKGVGPWTPDVLWEEAVRCAITKRHLKGGERLVVLQEGGAKASLVTVAGGVYDVILTSSGVPLVASTGSFLRVGEASVTVLFETTIISAFLSDVFPFCFQVGLEPVRNSLNHVQLQSIRDLETARASKGGGNAPTHRELRDEQHDRYFGLGAPLSTPNLSLPPGSHPINVSSDLDPYYSFGCGWSNDGLLYCDGYAHCVQEGYGEGDVIGVSVNLLTGEVSWYKNGAKIKFSNYSNSKEIAVRLPSIVAFKPTVYLQSTATRNPIADEQGMQSVVSTILGDSLNAVQGNSAKGSIAQGSLAQLELMSVRVNLTDPFKCKLSNGKSENVYGFAQFVDI